MSDDDLFAFGGYDYDITSNYHRGDPQSSAAHASTARARASCCEVLAHYLAGRSQGATFAEARDDLNMVRQTVTSRLSDLQHKHRRALPVDELHHYGLFTEVEAERPVPGSKRRLAQVLMGREQVIGRYGRATWDMLLGVAEKRSHPHGIGIPIERMSERLWVVYDFVDRCGHNGTTCDAADLRLRLGQGNCSNRFRDLRVIKAVVAVGDLHRIGEFLDVRATRDTRQHQAAKVVVSIETIIRAGISNDQIGQLLTEDEIDRLLRLLKR